MVYKIIEHCQNEIGNVVKLFIEKTIIEGNLYFTGVNSVEINNAVKKLFRNNELKKLLNSNEETIPSECYDVGYSQGYFNAYLHALNFIKNNERFIPIYEITADRIQYYARMYLERELSEKELNSVEDLVNWTLDEILDYRLLLESVMQE